MKQLFSRIKRRIKWFLSSRNKETLHLNTYDNIEEKSLIEIYGALRHEAHRLEKAFYNNLLESKTSIYDQKYLKVKEIQDIIIRKNPDEINNPVYQWSIKITESYPNIGNQFVKAFSSKTKSLNFKEGNWLLEQYKERRSCRMWGEPLSRLEIEKLIPNLVQAAKWAPNSGNRQAIRLRPITEKHEKELLVGLKEKHCYSAPLLIYAGIDTRLYGALSSFEESMYLDGAAAITQMTIYLETIGLGTSWNHFGLDMINSRQANVEQYEKFKTGLKIPDFIMPIAILAIGKPIIKTPPPARMPDNTFLIK